MKVYTTSKNICKKYQPFKLEFDGTGNYDMEFTFFVRFTCPRELIRLRSELLELSKPFMSEEEHDQHLAVGYVPHSTVLYDDIDPDKVISAYQILSTAKFLKPVEVNELLLWKVSLTGQEIVARLSLA